MREIKFRAWDKTYKHMIDAFADADYTFEEIIQPWNRFELMQYTGLKDKNGKEIYEGDIIGCNEYWTRGVVTWFPPRYALVQKNDYIDIETHDGFFMEDCKVIGNIHENPELLRGK